VEQLSNLKLPLEIFTVLPAVNIKQPQLYPGLPAQLVAVVEPSIPVVVQLPLVQAPLHLIVLATV
jgi:hypothetical protein